MKVICTELVKEFATAAETVRALDGLSLTVENGEFLALRGASGSGKSTLLNLIAGLDLPTTGSVQVDSRILSDGSGAQRAQHRLRNTGVVFQDNNLIDEFTLIENVMVPLRALGHPHDRARAEALDGLERVGIAELADRRPRDVSGGQRQRAGVARAIAGPRTLLLADEPTGSLDSATSATLFATLRGLARTGMTVITATHDPLIEDFADRDVNLTDGKISAHRSFR